MNKKNFTPIFIYLIISLFSLPTSFAQSFTDVSLSAGIDYLSYRDEVGIGVGYGGIVVFDYNNDGYEDIYCPGGTISDALFKNNGDGTFTDVINEIGTKEITDEVLTLAAFAGDINNDGFRDLLVTTGFPLDTILYFSPNLLFLNNGDGTFSDISYESNIGKDTVFSGPATFGDINNDGFLDIYVSNFVEDRLEYANEPWDGDVQWSGLSPDNLWVNNGDLTFTDMALEYGVVDPGAGLGCAFFDYNNDGNMDLFGANDDSGTPNTNYANTLYVNQFPNNSFVDIAGSAGIAERNTSMGVAIGDYDNDGWMDYYVTYCGDNSLFKNNKDGTFTNTTIQAGVVNDDLIIVDSLNDYYTLMYTYIPDEDFVGIDSSILKICDSETSFCTFHTFYLRVVDTDIETEWQPWFGFRINNGVFNLEIPKNSSNLICEDLPENVVPEFGIVPFNNGVENVVLDYDLLPSTGWGANFFDFDNDTDLDLFVANGNETPEGPVYDNPNSMYSNNGNGSFTDISEPSGLNSPWSARGSVTFDYDNDGDEDLFVLNLPFYEGYQTTIHNHSHLYRNNLVHNDFNNWLKVKLEGVTSNKDGIGAMVKIYYGTKSSIRQIDGGSSGMSQNSIIAHFGLRAYDKVDSLEITWPGGCKQMIYDIDADQMINIVENCGLPTSVDSDQLKNKIIKAYPVPSNGNISFEILLEQSEMIELEILDFTGRVCHKVYKGPINKGNSTILNFNSDKLSSGIYNYCLNTKNGSYCDKIIVIK